MKILNLYAGIGGNRKYWDGGKHEIVAIEMDSDFAAIYRDFFPNDEVIETDAHEYLRKNMRDFDFIWSSPPCPSHSRIRVAGTKNGQYGLKYPDMKLWQEIIVLDKYFDGRWVVENVQPYYDEMVNWDFVAPQLVDNHYFWSDFHVSQVDLPVARHSQDDLDYWMDMYGFDLTGYGIDAKKKRKALRNCVHPELGRSVFQDSRVSQSSLDNLQ